MMQNLKQITDLFAFPPAKLYKGVKSASQYLTMRDGIHITIDVMLPIDLSHETRLPTVMIMAR